MQSHIESSNYDEDNINIREELDKYLRYWPWFIISVILFICAAFIYLRYTPSSYQTTASILIKDENSSSMSQIAMFNDLGIGDKFSTVNLENEIEILKSRNITERVVRQLQLHIRYYTQGKIKTQEIYGTLPFQLEVLSEEENWPKEIPLLNITPLSLTEFTINSEGLDKENFSFGDAFNYAGLELKLTAKENLEKDKTTQVGISSIASTVDSYRRNIEISVQGKQSSIITINSVSAIPEKSRVVIDELIHQFNRDAIQDKNTVSKNTADFIDERLHIIWGELDSVETGKVSFKEANRLVDLQKEGQLFLENASEFNKRLLEVQTELSQVQAMIRFLESSDQTSLLPANLGISESGLNSLIQQYNLIVLERNQLLVNSTETHPTVKSLTEQLVALKANVLQSLTNAKGSLDIKIADLEQQERYIGTQLSGIPLKEKDFTNIERQQEIKQSLYLYLLQKREEASIALAVTEPKAKIVDSAYTPIRPVAPKKMIILLATVILGVLVPFGIIYLRNLLDNKVRKRNDVSDAISNATVLAEIPALKNKESETIVQKNDLGILAESFRVLRTNLQYAGITRRNKQCQVLLVTSSIKGEGKTMVSANLGMSLAHAGNRVLLIGADIRNPQLQRFFSERQDKRGPGLTEYLVYEDTKITDYLLRSEISENLDILHSGSIPPNPAELWLSTRVDDLLKEGKEKYDYIILDTAPTLLVTDTLILSPKVDATIYVVRAGYTQKNILEFANTLKKEEKLLNVNYVLNDVSEANYGYGGKYGYGYGYHADEKTFWQKVKQAMFG